MKALFIIGEQISTEATNFESSLYLLVMFEVKGQPEKAANKRALVEKVLQVHSFITSNNEALEDLINGAEGVIERFVDDNIGISADFDLRYYTSSERFKKAHSDEGVVEIDKVQDSYGGYSTFLRGLSDIGRIEEIVEVFKDGSDDEAIYTQLKKIGIKSEMHDEAKEILKRLFLDIESDNAST